MCIRWSASTLNPEPGWLTKTFYIAILYSVEVHEGHSIHLTCTAHLHIDADHQTPSLTAQVFPRSDNGSRHHKNYLGKAWVTWQRPSLSSQKKPHLPVNILVPETTGHSAFPDPYPDLNDIRQAFFCASIVVDWLKAKWIVGCPHKRFTCIFVQTKSEETLECGSQP